MRLPDFVLIIRNTDSDKIRMRYTTPWYCMVQLRGKVMPPMGIMKIYENKKDLDEL